MAQVVVSWLLAEGRYRVHATNAIGRRKARIIEIEVTETGESFCGSARKMKRLLEVLQGIDGDNRYQTVLIE